MLLTTEPPLQPPNSFLMLHSMPLFQWQHFGFSLFIPNVGMNTKHLKNIHEIPRNRTKSLLLPIEVGIGWCAIFSSDLQR